MGYYVKTKTRLEEIETESTDNIVAFEKFQILELSNYLQDNKT